MLAADYEILDFLRMTSLSCLGEKFLNIFSFRGHRTLKPRSKFIFKNLFLFSIQN